MPWSDTEGYWVDGVASSDRTRSGGGVEFYDPIYGFGITAQNEGSVLADIPRLVSQLQHKYVKKKCSQRALKLIFTTFADFTDFTEEFHAPQRSGREGILWGHTVDPRRSARSVRRRATQAAVQRPPSDRSGPYDPCCPHAQPLQQWSYVRIRLRVSSASSTGATCCWRWSWAAARRSPPSLPSASCAVSYRSATVRCSP